MICHDTHKPYEKFEHVLWLDIVAHFVRHHPAMKEFLMANVEVYANGDWVKPKSVLVDSLDAEDVKLKKPKK